MIGEVVLRARNPRITRERGKAQLFAHHEIVVNVRALRANATLEQLHAIHADLDAIPLLDVEAQGVAFERAATALDAAERAAGRKSDAARVTDKRRIAVLRHKMRQIRRLRRGRWKKSEESEESVAPPYDGLYEHLAARAAANLPHEVRDEELGVAHETYEAAGTVVYRMPLLEERRPGLVRTLARLLGAVLPTCVSDLALSAAAVTRVRVVQYAATEPAGVGYVLYALLPILDHASAMCLAGEPYEETKRATLRAISLALQPAQ